MSYCPKCRHEYADTVEVCVDCGVRLRRGQRPVELDLEFGDFLLPLGALFCGLVALGMLWLRVAAQFGWIKGTFATLVQTQPACLTVFYAFAVIACAVVLTAWIIRRLIMRLD